MSRPQVLPVLILNLYLAGIYTNIFLPLGPGLFVPNVLGIGAAALMVVSRPKRFLNRRFWGLSALLAFLALATVFATSGDAHLAERMQSFLQMAAAILSAHIAIHYALSCRIELLSGAFGAWTLFIALGCMLEAIGLLRPVSDAFREVAYSNRWTYSSINRDLTLYGGIRPNLFTQEPSHVAKAFVAFSLAWFLTTRNSWRWHLLLLATAVTVFYLRGPFVLLAPALAYLLAPLVTTRRPARRMLGTAVMTVLVMGLLLGSLALFFPGRWQFMASGEDLSLYMRLTGPFTITGMALADHPLFGAGLGAKDYLWPYAAKVYSHMAGTDYLWTVRSSLSGNGLANSISYFGVIGSLLFYGLLVNYFRLFTWVTAFTGMILVFVFFNLDGAIEGVRTWGYVAIGLIAFAKAEWVEACVRAAPQLVRTAPMRQAHQWDLLVAETR